MMYTTYFARLRDLPPNVIPISICAKAPNWYAGLQYKKLAPKYEFFMEWKKNNDNAYYVEHYNQEVLAQLNALRVLTELQMIMPEEVKIKMDKPFYANSDWHIALVCYEKPNDFCHRHLVSQWLRDNGFSCGEFLFLKG